MGEIVEEFAECQVAPGVLGVSKKIIRPKKYVTVSYGAYTQSIPQLCF